MHSPCVVSLYRRYGIFPSFVYDVVLSLPGCYVFVLFCFLNPFSRVCVCGNPGSHKSNMSLDPRSRAPFQLCSIVVKKKTTYWIEPISFIFVMNKLRQKLSPSALLKIKTRTATRPENTTGLPSLAMATPPPIKERSGQRGTNHSLS